MTTRQSVDVIRDGRARMYLALVEAVDELIAVRLDKAQPDQTRHAAQVLVAQIIALREETRKSMEAAGCVIDWESPRPAITTAEGAQIELPIRHGIDVPCASAVQLQMLEWLASRH